METTEKRKSSRGYVCVGACIRNVKELYRTSDSPNKEENVKKLAHALGYLFRESFFPEWEIENFEEVFIKKIKEKDTAE